MRNYRNTRHGRKQASWLSKARLRSLFTKKRLAFAGGLLAIFMIVTPVLTYAYFARDISDRERLMNRNSTGIVLVDSKGETFYEYGRASSGDEVPVDKVSESMKEALIASEDKDFYEHEGYSVRGIIRALFSNVTSRDATNQGGSTITQQLVKNTLLTADQNYLRKYQEVSMAIAVEREYTKDEILEMYLNSVYYGEGAFGITEAAQSYYGKSPADLTAAESAMLVGVLPAPNTYSPISGDPELAKQRQQYVLTKMVEQKYLTAAEKEAALAQELNYSGGEAASQSFQHAQHYALMVLDELNEKYGEERVSRSGFRVTTTLDLAAQKEAEAIVERRVASFASRGGENAGLVAIDPSNGHVKALVGSVSWENEEFGKVNMALTPRQPGSSFKPIYYAEAFDKKLITASTIINDQPKTYGTWAPQNYDFRFRGEISVRNALATSLNIPAAEVMQKLGPEEATEAARRMSIRTVTEPEKYGLTLALGTAETKLLEMTNAYAAFAAGGMQHDTVLITEIVDKYDGVVFQHRDRAGERVMGEDASFLISSILSDNTARAPTFGSSLNIAGRQVAVKTGTTDDNKDAWTIGYSPSLAVGVWVGNNQNEPMRGLAGGSSAGLIWRDTITAMLKGTEVKRFEKPASVRQVTICRGTDMRAVNPGDNTTTEYFIRGTEPKGECNVSRQVEEQPKPQQEQPKPEEKKPEKPEKPEEPEQPTEEEIKPGATDLTNPTTPDGGTTTGDGTTPTTPTGGRGSEGSPPTPAEPEESGNDTRTQSIQELRDEARQ